MASYYDHKTGRVPRPTIVHDKQGVDDPHDNGSLNLDAGARLDLRQRPRPNSTRLQVSQQGTIQCRRLRRVSEEEMTYPQPSFVPGRGWLHLFTKYTKGPRAVLGDQPRR